jgi:transposase
MTVLTDSLPDDPDALKERAAPPDHQGTQRHHFGRRAETLPEDQMLLGLEDVEQVAASNEAKIETANPVEQASRATKRRINRGSLPAHLPRVEMVIDVESASSVASISRIGVGLLTDPTRPCRVRKRTGRC